MSDRNLNDVNDQELMSLLAVNDLNAWSELVNRFSKLVYSIAFQILKNESDTEDAVQNTFVSLKLYSSKFDGSQFLVPWLSTVAGSEAIRIYNKKKIVKKRESVRMTTLNLSHQSQRRTAPEIAEQKEIEIMVKKAIDLLPETSRLALTLYYAGGMNQKDIAKELGLSQFSISEKINSGLEKIKKYLKNAGVHASILLTPQLVKESIIFTQVPRSLILKLTEKLPSKSELASVKIKSYQFGNGVLNKNTLKWFLICLPIVVVFIYFILPEKIELKIQDIAHRRVSLENSNIKYFQPVDYSNYLPFYFKKGKRIKNANVPSVWEEGNFAYLGDNDNWSVQKNSKGLLIKHGSSTEKLRSEGLFLNQRFNQSYFFKGTINLNSENSLFGFVLNTPNAKEKLIVVQNNKDSNYTGEHMDHVNILQSGIKGEVDFKVYIWSSNNKWNAICFYWPKENQLKSYFTTISLEFECKEFRLGLFTNGKTEVSDFLYSPLAENWDPRLEPDIKSIIEKLPKMFW